MDKIENLNLDIAYASFPYFARVVGADVMSKEELRYGETFVFKPFHLRWAKNLQELDRYMILGFRSSMKSTMIRLRFMWKAFRLLRGHPNPAYEGIYFSLTDPLASHHTARLKRYIQSSPLFKDCIHDTDAESVIKMTMPNGKRFVVTPAGIFAAQRGQRPDEVGLDDILGDVNDRNLRMDLGQIDKVTDRILQSVQYLPRKGGAIFGGGTPQTDNDFFAVAEESADWTVDRQPAEDIHGHSVMPELFSDEKLKALRGEEGSELWIAYQKEMLVRPVRQVFSTFLPKGLIEASIMKNVEPMTDQPKVSVGALDMGKHKHPGQLVFYAVEHGYLKQIFSQWYDRKEFRDMLADASMYAGLFNSVLTLVDNTRNDFELALEQGYVLLPPSVEGGESQKLQLHQSLTPFVINMQSKWKISQRVRSALVDGKMKFKPDPRQKRSLLLVDKDLKTAETKDGHGESFTTAGLSAHAAYECGFLFDEDKGQPKKEPTEQEKIKNAYVLVKQMNGQNCSVGGPGTMRF